MADRMMELMGASEEDFAFSSPSSLGLAVFALPTRPITANTEGSQPRLAAATVMRLATNEFPRSEPATTMQINTAPTIPDALPKSSVIAVWVLHVSRSTREGVSREGLTTATLSVVATTDHGRRM